MKPKQSSGTRPVHQTVAGEFEFKTPGKSIAIRFTDQRLSPHAGSATFWGWLRGADWISTLSKVLPHALPLSNNHLLPIEKALAFIHGLLCDARKLTHVAYLRRDPVVPELIGVRRVASQSALSRFFQGFDSAGTNLRCFRRLWHWCLNRLPSTKEGYTLDLDSTRLLHEDGHQQGVAVGYTRVGLKPCLHPLLAVIAEVRLVAQLWLRPGNTSCGGNALAFFLDLWENLPRHIRLRGVRADAGFCLPELLALWEQLHLPYAVVAQLSQPIQKLIKGDLPWQPTEVPGTEVAELEYQSLHWPYPRRLVLIRHQVRESEDTRAGKRLLDVPGYRFQALVTSLPATTHRPLALLQRPVRLRECDQGTAGRFCVADLVSGKVLGQRGGVESGHADLQLKRPFPTTSGLAAEGDHPLVEILALCHGGSFKSSLRQDHDQTRRPHPGARLVAPTLGENPKPFAQLQCSRKSSRLHRIIL
jgi:hypothetical protein